jgi:hypothetical protein
LPIADELEEVVGTILCRGGQQIVAVLGEGRVPGIVDAVKQAQGLIARRTDDPSLAQIVDDGSAMNLLHCDGSELQHLWVAASRIGHVSHVAFVARVPHRVARLIAEQLGAHSARYFLS